MNDKFKHFVAGAIITLIVGAVSQNAIYGLIASMIAGIGKELWDYMGNGVSDFDDVLATLQGAIVACIILILW